MSYSSISTSALLNVLALILELEQPVPVDLVFELNLRGIIFEEETLIP